MKMKREKVAELHHVCNQLGNTKGSVKFGFIIAKNKRLAEPEVKSLQEASTPLPEYIESEKKRISLCEEFAELDEQGKPIVFQQNYKIDQERSEEFNDKLEALREENKDIIEEQEKRQEEVKALLEEEIDIDFTRIKSSDMPEEMVGRDIDVLFDLIDMDDDTKK